MGSMLISATPSPTPSAIPLSPSPEPHANIDLSRRPRVRDRHPVLGRPAASVLGQRLDALAGRLRHPHRREPGPVGNPVRVRLQHPGRTQVLSRGMGQRKRQADEPGLERVLDVDGT